MNDTPLWERQDWDTDASFAAFQLWLLQEDRPRSLDAAYRLKVGRESYTGGTQIRASDTWRLWFQARDKTGQPIAEAVTWTARAKAWDDHLAEVERQKWAERQSQVRESDWELGGQLRALVLKTLAEDAQRFIRDKRRVIKGADGLPDREIITLSINTLALIRAAEVASALQRQAAEILPPAQRHEMTGRDGGPLEVNDVTALQGVTPGMAAAAMAAMQAAVAAQQAAIEAAGTGDDDRSSGSDE